VLANGTTEYVPMGTYWSDDWTVEDQATTARTTARDRMELLRKATFAGGTVYQDTTLYALAQAVLDDAIANIPMTDLTYQIDTELQYYAIPWAYFERKSYMQAIRDIVEACMGQAFMSREDVLIIEGPNA
jgi:hypothetical protein